MSESMKNRLSDTRRGGMAERTHDIDVILQHVCCHDLRDELRIPEYGDIIFEAEDPVDNARFQSSNFMSVHVAKVREG